MKLVKRGWVEKFRDILHGSIRAYVGGELKLPGGFLVADGFEAPFPDEHFDAVYCMNNIYFALAKTERKLAKKRLQQVGRLVKPNGHFILTGYTPSYENDYIILTKSGRVFDPTEIAFKENEDSQRRLDIILESLSQSAIPLK